MHKPEEIAPKLNSDVHALIWNEGCDFKSEEDGSNATILSSISKEARNLPFKEEGLSLLS